MTIGLRSSLKDDQMSSNLYNIELRKLKKNITNLGRLKKDRSINSKILRS